MAGKKSTKKPVRRNASKGGKPSRKSRSQKPRRPRPSEHSTAKPIALGEFMALLTQAHAASAEAKGACLVSDPSTGATFCTLATPDFCKTTLKGTFVGGPCGQTE